MKSLTDVTYWSHLLKSLMSLKSFSEVTYWSHLLKSLTEITYWSHLLTEVTYWSYLMKSLTDITYWSHLLKSLMSPIEVTYWSYLTKSLTEVTYWNQFLKSRTDLCNINQLDALFILSLFSQSTHTYFGHIGSLSSGSILYIYKYQLLYIHSILPANGLPICPKYVESEWRNKLRINSAPSWFFLHRYIGVHGQQNIKFTYWCH
jgi:hypothetical protein